MTTEAWLVVQAKPTVQQSICTGAVPSGSEDYLEYSSCLSVRTISTRSWCSCPCHLQFGYLRTVVLSFPRNRILSRKTFRCWSYWAYLASLFRNIFLILRNTHHPHRATTCPPRLACLKYNRAIHSTIWRSKVLPNQISWLLDLPSDTKDEVLLWVHRHLFLLSAVVLLVLLEVLR